MPSSDAYPVAPQQVVFIDSNVPDLQDLLNGLQPGEAAFVIDPTSDGVDQIAKIIADNNLADLASISIVGHGASGAIDLGSTVLNDADLSAHACALRQIGAALAPGGSLQLYSCSTASGAAGQQFIADLSRFMGGANVAAATRDIGLTASGANWTLDASAGTTGAPVHAPFTAVAMANFQGVLAGTTLAAGDIAITGYNSDDPDTFSFVVLKPIAAGTVINFTDSGWLSAGGFSNFAGDSTVTYTAASAIAAGTVITSTDPGFSGSLNLDAAGDQIIAYQGPAATPTLLYAINFDNTTSFDANATNANTSALPTGLTVGTTAVAVSFDDAYYVGPSTGIETTQIADISHTNSWAGSNTDRQTPESGPILPPATELWIAATSGGDQNLIVHADDTGTHSALNIGTLFTPVSGNNPSDADGLNGIDLLQLDPQNQKYFIATQDTTADEVLIGSLSSVLANPAATPTYTVLYSNPNANTDGLGILGLADDPASQQVFFIEGHSLFKNSYSGNTGTDTTVGSTTDGAFLNGLALDLPHHIAYFASSTSHTSTTTTKSGQPDPSDSHPTANVHFNYHTVHSSSIYETSNLTSSSGANSVTISKLMDIPNSDGTIFGGVGVSGFTVDTQGGTQGIIYFSTQTVGGSTPEEGGIFWIDPTDAGHTIHTLFRQTAGQNDTLDKGTFTNLQIDHATGRYYVSLVGTAGEGGTIWTGSLSTPGTPTLFETMPTFGATQPAPEGFSLDNAPTLTATASNPTFTESASNPASSNNTPVSLISGAAASDTDNFAADGVTVELNGATVAISGSFSGSGDSLYVLDGATHRTSGTFTGTNITVSETTDGDGNEILTLSGLDTAAHYDTVLNDVQYTSTSDNPTNYGNNTSRSISFDVFDGLLDSTAVTSTVAVVGTDDAPVNNLPATPSINEDTLATISGLTITDVDADPANQNIQVTLSVAHGTLTLNTGVANGITAGEITAGASGTNTITITATQNQINTTFGNATGLQYQGDLNFNSGFGAEALHIVTSDMNHTGSGGPQTDTDDLTLNVVAVNDPPNVQPDTTTAVSYTENGSATALFAGENVDTPLADVDQPANYAGGSVDFNITAGAVTGDRISLQAGTFHISGGNILDASNVAIGTISDNGTNHVTISALTSAATPSVVDALLKAFSFDSASDDPTGADRTVTLTFNDGGNTGGGAKTDVVTQTVHVTAVNDPPVNHVPAGQNVNEDTALVFNAAHSNLISITDPDVESGNETVTLSVSHGVLTLSSTAGLSFTTGDGTADASMVFSGTLAAVDTALNGLSYIGASNFNGNDTLTITTNDNGNTPAPAQQDQDSVAIAVNAVNDAPVVVNGTSVSLIAINEDATPAGAPINTLLANHFSDAADDQTAVGGSAANNFAGIAVTADAATASQGVWQYSNDGGANWTNIVSASVSTANALLIAGTAATDLIRFLPTANFNGTPGSLTVHLVDDSGGPITSGNTANLTTSGGSTPYSSGTVSIGESVNAINDAPTFTGLDGTPSFTEGGSAVVLDNNALVHDVELDALNSGNGNYAGATLTLTRDGGASADDVFSGSGTLTLTAGAVKIGATTVGSFTNSGGTLAITFNSSATTANVESVLDQITYSNGSNAPPASVQVDYTFNDGNSGTQGSGGALAASGSVTVSITPTNDGPDVTPDFPQAVTYVEGQANPIALLSTGAVTDPDQPASFAGGSLNVTITSGLDSGNDALVLLGSSPFTVSGTDLKDGTTVIGQISGVGTSSISITSLTTAATPTEVDKLLEAFGFQTTSVDTTDRSVVYTFHDGGNVGDVPPGLLNTTTQVVHVTPPANGQLWYLTQGSTTNARLAYINDNGSGSTVLVDDSPTADLSTSFPQDVQVDWAAGVYFVVSNGGADGSNAKVLMGHINSTAAPTVVYTAPVNDSVNTLQVDIFTHHVYVGKLDAAGVQTNSGILDFTYSPGSPTALTLTPVATNGGWLVKTSQISGLPNDPQQGFPVLDPRAFTLDHATNTLFFVNELDGGASENQIYKVDLANPTDVTPLTEQTQFPVTTNGNPYPNGYITGVQVDPSTGLVYFTTHSQHPSPDATYNVATDQIYYIAETASGSTAATAVTLTGMPNANVFYPGEITLDLQNRVIYVGSEQRGDGTGSDANSADDGIFAFQLSADGHSASYIQTITPSPAFTENADNIADMTFDDLPVLSGVSGTATHAVEQGAAVTLLTVTPTITDFDGDHLSSATVKISAGTFSSNESSTSDDHLGFAAADVTGSTINGTSITFSYDSASETLTLSGYDTLANYQLALSEVQYSTTGDNPTNYGVNATRTLDWQVNDGAGGDPVGTNVASTTINIDAVNDAPANTVPAAQSVNEDTALTFTSGGGNAISVSDPDNQSLTVTLSAGHGDVTLGSVTNLTVTGTNGSHSVTIAGLTADINNALATLSYHGDLNFNGADTLTISTDDGIAPATQNAVPITVSPVDDAPSGTDHEATTALNTPYVFQQSDFGFSDAADAVAGGSSANTFAAVKITTLSVPAGATLQDNGANVTAGQIIPIADITGGKLVFTPATGAGGLNYANFTFQVQDDGGAVAPNANLDPTPNLMTIDVGSGFGPVAVADTVDVLEGATASAVAPGVLGNDSGSSLTVTAVNGSAANLDQSTPGTFGELTLHADGSYSYIADQTPVIDGAANGAHPLDVFNYTESDGSSTATTTITFDIDRAPTTATHNVSVLEGASTGTVSANDTDPDGDALTATLTSSPTGNFGSLTLNANDTYSYTANNTANIDGAATGSHPTDTFTYTVDDGLGGITTETLNIAVDRAPAAPVDDNPANDGAGPVNGSIAEGAAIGTTVGITASSTDPDGDTPTYSLTDSAGGFFKIDANTGIVSVDTAGATGIDFESAPGHAYSITVQADDGHGGLSSQSFTIAVTDVAPPAPVDNNPANDSGPVSGSVLEGAAAGTTVGITASSTDVNGGTVTYSLTGDTSGGGFTINATSGVVTVADPTKIDFESTDPNHTYTVTVQASDGTLANTQDFTIAVTDANPSTPTDANGTADGVTEGAAAGTLVGITASSSDVNGPPVTYSLTDSAGGFFKVDPTTGVVSVDTAGATGINYETAPGHAYSITVQASDGDGGVSTQTFSIPVADVAPTSVADSYTVDEDTLLNPNAAAGVVANDTDINGGPLTAVLDTGPLHASSFTLNADGSFSYQGALNFNGSDSFTYHAFDGAQSGGTVTVSLNIAAVNDPPVFTNLGEGAHPAFTENGSSVLLDNNVTISDVELDAAGSGAYNGTTLTLARAGGPNTDDSFAGTGSLDLIDVNGNGENVSLDNGATFIGTFTNPGDGSISFTFNANATAANIDSVMHQIIYANVSDNPPTSVQIDWTFSDANGVAGGLPQGSGATPGIATGSVTVDITQVDDAPVLINVAPIAAYSPGSAGAVLSPGLQAFDLDATPPSTLVGWQGATVKIATGFFAGDELFVNLPTSGGFFITPDTGLTNISVASNVAGQLVLSGNDSVLAYQEVLDAVSFMSSAADPSNGGADPNRNITWQVTDGALNSQTPNTDPNNPVNDTLLHFTKAPTVDLDGSTAGDDFATSFTENGAPIAIANSNFSVTDPDDATLSSATVVLTNAKPGDALSIAGALPAGITSSIDTSVAGQITIHLSGQVAIADYQTAIGQIRFVNTSDNPDSTPRDITVQVSNSDASNVAHATINVIPVNDPPVLGNVAAAASVSFQGETITLSPGLTVSDVDNTTLFGATVAITAGTFAGDGDVLAANVSGTGITASYNAASETLTLSGTDTLAHYQQVLDSVAFHSTSTNPTNSNADPTRTVTWQVNDGSGANNLSATATTTIDVRPNPTNDFNGDKISDLLFQNNALGNTSLMIDLLNGATITSSVTIPNFTDLHVEATGDFNHDGKADIILQDSGGAPQIWFMNGTNVIGTASLPDPGPTWHVIATGDFNSDGNTDILWQNNDGSPSIWEMNGTSVIGWGALPNPGPTWHAIGTGDFNGDGNSDILWQNNDGSPSIWEMNGTSVVGWVALPNPGPTWHVIGSGDFNGDGKADILWQNNDGSPSIWEMNGGSVIGWGALPNPGPTWHVIGTSDINGDGKADILWQNNDGSPSAWEMNGTSVVGWVSLPNPGASWQLKDDGPIAPDAMANSTITGLFASSGSTTVSPQNPNHDGQTAPNLFASNLPITGTPPITGTMYLSAPDTLISSLSPQQGLTGFAPKTLGST